MIDASRVTLRGIHLVRVKFELNIKFLPDTNPVLTFSPVWGFPCARLDNKESVGVQQYVGIQSAFEDAKGTKLTPEQSPLTLQLDMMGDYSVTGAISAEELKEFRKSAVIQVFPFLREALHNISSRNWNPGVLVPPTNLLALLDRWFQKEAEEATANAASAGKP